MKRFLYIAALFLLAISCTKDPEPQPAEEDCLTITAPTLADGSALEWKKGDIVAICAAREGAVIYTATAIEDGRTARFKGDVPKSMEDFKAFFPYSMVKSNASETNFIFSMASTQKVSAGSPTSSLFPLIYYGSEPYKAFTMKPLSGLLKIQLAGSDIKSVKLVCGSSSEDYVSSESVSANAKTGNTSSKSTETSARTAILKPAGATTLSPGWWPFTILAKEDPRTITGYTLEYTKTDGSVITRTFPGVLSIEAGKITSVSGTEKDIEYTTTTVSGKVTNASTGNGIAGVLVSDGVNFVKTAADGSYSINSDLNVSQCVFVILPSEYEFSVNKYNGWTDFAMLDRNKNSQTVDFKLSKRRGADDKYRLILLGDPQQMSSRAHSAPSWKYVCDGINSYRGTCGVPLYMVSMGDMVTNEIEVVGMAEAYLSTQKSAGLCTISVAGNHDHVQKATSYYASVSGFVKWFGPWNRSFNLGKHHFVILDNLAWCIASEERSYSYGLNEQAISFLEKDLSYVDKSVPLHVLMHVPMTKSSTGAWPDILNGARFFESLKGRNVNLWYGHIHNNVNFHLTEEELAKHAPGVKSIDTHVIARCGGNWSCSGEVNKDGTPRGFVELDLDGENCSWRFHSLDENYAHVMNVYVPGQFAGENLTSVDDKALYCNVYCWQNDWSVPEIWVAGTKKGTMTQVKINGTASYDPMYQHFYPIWKAQGLMEQRDEPPSSSDCSHLFKYVPDSSLKELQIKLNDKWGNVYTKDVKLK